MKIKYIREDTFAVPPLKFINKGEFIDLALAETLLMSPGEYKCPSLGVRIQLPKDFEAWVIPRSSTPKKHKIIQANSVGLIDSSYNGPKDWWRLPCYAIDNVFVKKGTRVCQFRIMPSMKAGVWTKLKWLFTRKLEFVEEEYLTKKTVNRGGFGTTGD